MDDICWFFIALMLSVAAWLLGRRAGAAAVATARLTAVTGVVLLIAWTWLLRHPSVSLELLPVAVLARLEGVGSLPMFALILGVCRERSHLPRQRAAVGWAAALGVVYLINGGGWLLQSTPAAAFAGATQVNGRNGLVLQSQEFSCVPAACATLLGRWGQPVSEGEMARLTRTRPGTGSTTLRALEGLSTRLAGTHLRPVLLEVELEDLARLPYPLITPLQFEAARQHMVAIDRPVGDSFLLLDPVDGTYLMSKADLQKVFTGRVIVLEERR